MCIRCCLYKYTYMDATVRFCAEKLELLKGLVMIATDELIVSKKYRNNDNKTELLTHDEGKYVGKWIWGHIIG